MKHLAYIKIDLESVQRGGSTRWALCLCGWKGPERASLELATDDALFHERQAHGTLVIPIADDDRCSCSAAVSCPLGRTGSELRCTRRELRDAGIVTKGGRVCVFCGKDAHGFYGAERIPKCIEHSLKEYRR